MAKVRVIINPKGEARIDGVTGAGQHCLEATKNFEALLGAAIESSRSLTEEYYEEVEGGSSLLEVDGEAHHG